MYSIIRGMSPFPKLQGAPFNSAFETGQSGLLRAVFIFLKIGQSGEVNAQGVLIFEFRCQEMIKCQLFQFYLATTVLEHA